MAFIKPTSSSDIIVALDDHENDAVENFLALVSPSDCKIKIGKSLFTRKGPSVVRRCVDLGFDVFLDLKFHDIPNTVKKACQAAAELGVWMLNVHCSGGMEMMAAAREGVDSVSIDRKPLLIGVTILTSLSEEAFSSLSYQYKIPEMVVQYSQMASAAKLDGVVCSAWEVSAVKSLCGPSFLCVTPGIRIASNAHEDQSRVMTPEQARSEGADFFGNGP